MNAKSQSPSSTWFAVADVTPATEKLPEAALHRVCEEMLRTRLLVCPAADRKVVESGNFHSLIAATALAYQYHYPLALSPDMIWVTVLQGVAQHIKNHAEKLRPRLVHHQTRIELVVDTGLSSFMANEAEMLPVVRTFAEQIARHVKPEKQGLFQAEFTTTTDNERIVAGVVLMDAFEPYFDYVSCIICGIPSVILEGRPEDWKLLGTKVRALHDSDLELSWWTQHLLPLCDHFVSASRGCADSGHWNNLCKIIQRYGVDDLNGWMLKFIPYVKGDQGHNHPNPVLSLTNEPEDKDVHGEITGCTPKMLPSGVSQVPVAFMKKGTGQAMPVEFIGGFFGVRQSDCDLSLRPVVGWAISEVRLIDRAIARMQLQDEATAQKEIRAGRPVWLRRSYGSGAEQIDGNERFRQLRAKFDDLPADIVRFYDETNGAVYRASKGKGMVIFSLQVLEPLWESSPIIVELNELLRQGHISEAVHRERVDFNKNYSRLVCFSRDDRTGDLCVFGRVPRSGDDSPEEKSLGEVFRWKVGRDGGEYMGKGRTREAFTPVARTFAEWLWNTLDDFEAAASNPKGQENKA